MRAKLFINGKPIPPVMLAVFTAACFGFGYLVILVNLPEALLFLLLTAVLFAILHYPDWVVYGMLGIWVGVIIWVDSQIALNFPISLISVGAAALVVVGILLYFHLSLTRQRGLIEEYKERFRVVADYSPNFEYWEHPDGTLLYVSPSCEQLTGYTQTQYLQNRALRLEIILPEDREKLINGQPPNLRKPQGIKKVEVRIQHRNGQTRWVEYTTRQVYDETGHYIGKRVSIQDVSQRKQELENLKIKFERLHFALETTDDGVWDINLVDGEAYFNSRYATMLGLKPGENNIALKDYYALVHPDDLPDLLKTFKAHMTWKIPSFESEYRLLSRYGKWRWVLDRGRIIAQDHNGKPTRMVGTHVDITERKMIEEALQQSEVKFRQLAENMREVFWLRDRESGRFIYISPAFNEIWGRSPEQMYEDANLFVESIYWEDFGRVFHALRELVTHGIIFNEEYRVEHPDSSVRWIWARAYPIYDSQGSYYRIAGIAEDITERKEADSAMRESEKRYRDLIERQGGGVSIIDPYQNIVYMNPAGEDVFGVQRGSIAGRNLKEFMDDEQYSFISRQSNIRQQGAESSFEVTINRMDAEQRSLLITTTPRFDVNGQFLGAIAIFKDITLRKEEEDKLRYIGLHDVLTGLYNRTYFEDEIERIEETGIFPVGVVVVDVDNLKMVNDQLGHSSGDDLLIRAGKVLKKSIRSDDIIARIGGDEFAILMPSCDENILHQVLNRIDININAENDQNDLNYVLSLSSGGFTCNQRGTLRESIKKADERMYEIKKKKKKRFFFTLPIQNSNE